MKSKIAVVLFLAISLGLVIELMAQDQNTPKKPTQEEMMAVYMKYATPGAEHKALQPLIGNWNLVTRMWMEPGKPPMESKGTAEKVWILGNRFVQENVSGDMNGMPFHGLGFTGYDIYNKKYTWIWMDEMSTMTMMGSGPADSTGKVFSIEGDYNDLMTGKAAKYKAVTKIIDNDKHVFEMYEPGPDGNFAKTFEIEYTRINK